MLDRVTDCHVGIATVLGDEEMRRVVLARRQGASSDRRDAEKSASESRPPALARHGNKVNFILAWLAQPGCQGGGHKLGRSNSAKRFG